MWLRAVMACGGCGPASGSRGSQWVRHIAVRARSRRVLEHGQVDKQSLADRRDSPTCEPRDPLASLFKRETGLWLKWPDALELWRPCGLGAVLTGVEVPGSCHGEGRAVPQSLGIPFGLLLTMIRSMLPCPTSAMRPRPPSTVVSVVLPTRWQLATVLSVSTVDSRFLSQLLREMNASKHTRCCATLSRTATGPEQRRLSVPCFPSVAAPANARSTSIHWPG